MAVTPDELLEVLGTVRRSIRRYGGRPVELSSLTGAQLELVRLVRREPGVSIAEAADRLRVAPNTVSTLVRQLADAGVLERHVHDTDRRVARLELDPQIRRKVDAWRDRRVVAIGEAMAKLSAAEQQRLGAALPVLARVVDELEAQGDRL